jgi:tRNA threonylcarbamoyladenosine biosynthesis protein TsaB
VISSKGEVIKKVTAGIIDEKSFNNIPENVRILLFGDGAPKCREIIKRNNVILAEDFRISASFMYKPVYKSFEERHFEDIAYFEPFYLKDFITSKPRKNLLGR